MKIIVTGGAGFIGSNFIFHMLKKHPDYRIICLDCLTYAGNLSTLAPVMDEPNFRFPINILVKAFRIGSSRNQHDCYPPEDRAHSIF